ncbi:MtrAB system histidine kinase MtrB [Asanoa siamensis]|uniref:MtrAB system histidine kinase MtrB n=1 Tax=Asanoa siamensis TaxID=926357 RepID=UPI001EF3C98B|nr:MtrAB system histidine kinase MtrB [Asanoa siamensis]
MTLFLVTVEHTWRRSLQVRVVTLTLVVSSLLVAVFAYVVAYRSSTILLNRAEQTVTAQMESGRRFTGEQLAVFGKAYEPNVQGTMQDIVAYLGGGDAQEPSSGLVVVRADAVELTSVQSRAVKDENLREVLGTDITTAVGDGAEATAIRSADLGAGRAKYLVKGAPVRTKFGQVELYYIEPLTTQDSAATQIRTTVLATGATLVLLLGLLAALVTRLVVRPVRVAARTAQRLSAGLLDQRMAVTGEDDLALLAASFNQMAANLQRQIIRLEDMSRLQRRFTSDVSHELRTPLTTVRMAADLIFAERDRFPADVSRTAEILQTELDRFESLLTDLLEISRYDAGFAMLDAEPTDLVPLVHRAVEPLRGLAERCGADLRVEVPATPVIADVDPRRVERILRNLVGNAVEHAEHRPVDVRLVSDGVAVAVAVRDRGVGLKPGEEKLVFNRFWRADPSRARQTGGTGLGLSISIEDARLHGGWLEAWGAPGQGAQFRLTLPVRAGDRLTASPLRLVPEDAELPAVLPPAQPRAITQAPAEVPR